MPEKLNRRDLRPELQRPDVWPVIHAYLDMMAARVRLMRIYRDHGCQGMTLLDTMMNLTVFAYGIDDGVQAQFLIDSFDAPKATIRGSLARLTRNGLVIRDPDKRYYPTRLTGKIMGLAYSTTWGIADRFCDAVMAYRRGR